MTITLKGTPPSLNRFAGRQNAWEYREQKERWTSAVYYKALQAQGGRQRQPPVVADVKITYFFADKKRRDPDNYAGKFLLDGLTKAGAIMDDDFRHIRLTLRGECDRERPRTIITVKEGNCT